MGTVEASAIWRKPENKIPRKRANSIRVLAGGTSVGLSFSAAIPSQLSQRVNIFFSRSALPNNFFFRRLILFPRTGDGK